MVTCESAKFEIEGILCKHILRIMSLRRLSSIPERYILSRWTIEARFVFDGGMSTAEEDNDEITPLHKWFLISKYQRYLDDYQCPKSLFKKMDETLNGWIADGEWNKKEKQNALLTSGSQVYSNIVMETPEISIHDPQLVKTKGRPRNATRFKSPIEVSQAESKRRRCKKCGQLGHNMRTCNKNSKVKMLITNDDADQGDDEE
ncbi:protein FAR1-RELATED SEQUENCE 2-like [Tasmannia lanceolata]|uniref:protein FAR1-RELATED SEQUENCE 2-like n=1 Tax=Tasmannia lanceolata TaxID=3420 RepID=UPI004064747F